MIRETWFSRPQVLLVGRALTRRPENAPFIIFSVCGVNARLPPEKAAEAFRLQNITSEEWAGVNCALEEFLAGHAENMARGVEQDDPARLLRKLTEGFLATLGGRCRRRPAKSGAHDPREASCRKRLRDPEFPQLIRFCVEGNDLLKRKITNAMSRRGWVAYPSRGRPPNVSASFSYLEKYQCAEPLRDARGELHFTGAGKCALLADFRERHFPSPRKSSSPPQLARWRPRNSGRC